MKSYNSDTIFMESCILSTFKFPVWCNIHFCYLIWTYLSFYTELSSLLRFRETLTLNKYNDIWYTLISLPFIHMPHVLVAEISIHYPFMDQWFESHLKFLFSTSHRMVVFLKLLFLGALVFNANKINGTIC